MNRANRGPLSEEHKRHISESVKAKWRGDSQYRNKTITGMQDRVATPRAGIKAASPRKRRAPSSSSSLSLSHI